MNRKALTQRIGRTLVAVTIAILLSGLALPAHENQQSTGKTVVPARPKLVVMIVVDQMRGDYPEKFRGQWSGGLKRLVADGAWFREAAYPYASTETCVGHSTISTGAFPASHGMIANAWWDRRRQQMVTCTSDANVKNIGYAGGNAKGGDSAAQMELPSFAEELKFQSGGATRIVTLSLKARAAITLAGHTADAVTWFDAGTWVTSPFYGRAPFVEEFAKSHPVSADYGKTWTLSLPDQAYLYDRMPLGASSVAGWQPGFPHALRGNNGGTPDEAFYREWATSPFANSYLTKMAEAAIDALRLGNGRGTDYLGVSYSSVDYVGHTFGPRSWELQDVLVQLDRDLGELFAHLDETVGKGNYVVALSADHGVSPTIADLRRAGLDANVLSMPTVQERIEKALEPFHLQKPAIAKIDGNDVYFSPGVYARLKENAAAVRAAIDAASGVPGVLAVYRAEDLTEGKASLLGMRSAFALSYYAGRSGDLFVLQKPYWALGSTTNETKHNTGASHGSPYYYDRHVPIFLMGYGVQAGLYFSQATPADIATTLSALCGVTLATHDGRVLVEALQNKRESE